MHKSADSNKLNSTFQAVLNVSLFGNEYRIANQFALNSIITEHIDSLSQTSLYLGHHNLHSLYLCRSNEEIQRYLNSVDYLWIDGMPLVWMLNILDYEISRKWRLTFLDWEKSIFPIANEKKWNVFLLGSTEENINIAHEVLLKSYPNANIKSHHGYIINRTNELNEYVVESINNFKTDLLLVGMGMPLQEQWLLENKKNLKAKVMLPIGGYFDYIAGKTYTPPRWSGRVGMEWLFRLISDPLRLGYRYLIEPWPVFWRFCREFIRHKFYQ